MGQSLSSGRGPRTDIDLAEFERMLLRQRKAASEGIRRIKEGTFSESLKDSTGESSTYDQHSADLAAETFEREKDLGLKEGLEIDLVEIDRALRRIEDGTYGYCVSCGEPVPEERLRAVPSAELCVRCKDSHEVDPEGWRPVEERVLRSFPPMGGIETLTDDIDAKDKRLPEGPYRARPR